MKKTIFITGASSGFGKMLVHKLSELKEFNIIATLRNSKHDNLPIANELQTLPNVIVYELDVTNQDNIDEIIKQTLDQFNTIDILVNNAGVFGGGLLEAHSIEQVQRLFNINLYAPLRLMKSVLPSMRKQNEGLIINVSSMLGFFSIPLNTVYCASKSALEALVVGSYHELVQNGVENILIEPGSFPTELYQKAGIKADLPEITKAYNGLYEQMSEYANKAVYSAIQDKNPDPNAVVEKIISLIQMPKGSRPLRNPIDQISGEVFSQKVALDLAALSAAQMKAYGF